MRSYDYILIGSGIAGLYTALQAHEQGSVLILTKGNIQGLLIALAITVLLSFIGAPQG